MSKYNYIPLQDLEDFVKNEVIAAKGANVVGLWDFLSTKDLKELSANLIKRWERRENCTVFNHLIYPVTDAVKSITEVGYNYITEFKPELIKLGNEKVKGKNISVVIPDEQIQKGQIPEYLFKLRKKPLENPNGYLLGLMEAFKDSKYEFPERLIGCEIIALPADPEKMHEYPGYHPNEKSVFEGKYLLTTEYDGEKYNIFKSLGDPTYHNFGVDLAIICENL